MDFAFYAVHFGYTRREYDSLTQLERAFIRRAYEDKVVSETTMLRDAVFNAVNNAMRRKGTPFRQLWHRAAETADREQIREDFRAIEDIEKRETGWIEKIKRAR